VDGVQVGVADAAPCTARAAATRRRILQAAAEEFAERGIAGTRIERVTQAARTNKAQLYAYFGSKDGLFDAVMADLVDRITSAVPVDGNDLADWALRLYDEYLRRPDLERQPAGALFAENENQSKLDAIAAAQAAGKVRAGDPFDLMCVVIAMSCAWSPASNTYAASADEPAAVHERRRALLQECVAAAVSP
jgi:AcrR family transcriptional regulator